MDNLKLDLSTPFVCVRVCVCGTTTQKARDDHSQAERTNTHLVSVFMSGKKMQTHDHTIRVWLRCAAACVPLSAVGRGRQGRGMFGEKAETE